jgi:hypothetical protein
MQVANFHVDEPVPILDARKSVTAVMSLVRLLDPPLLWRAMFGFAGRAASEAPLEARSAGATRWTSSCTRASPRTSAAFSPRRLRVARVGNEINGHLSFSTFVICLRRWFGRAATTVRPRSVAAYRQFG